MSMNWHEEVDELLKAGSIDDRMKVRDFLLRELPIHEIEQDWGVTAKVVLEALARSSELTRRMFRGVIAEAACFVEIIDKMDGWEETSPPGDIPFDFKIEKDGRSVTIQVKLQRSTKGEPMRANRAKGLTDSSQYVVETQKTRKGIDLATGENTRAYRFGQFDILGVCMQPSTGNWADFRFTVARWLRPRKENPEWLMVYQPVSLVVNDDWTDDLSQCIEWLDSGVEKQVDG